MVFSPFNHSFLTLFISLSNHFLATFSLAEKSQLYDVASYDLAMIECIFN